MDGLLPGMDAEQFEKAGFKKHDARIAEFRLYWQKLWQDNHQTTYITSPKKEGAILKRLLKELDKNGDGLAMLKRAAERLLTGHLKWFKGPPTIGAMSAHINALLEDKPNGAGPGKNENTVRPSQDDLDVYRKASRR